MKLLNSIYTETKFYPTFVIFNILLVAMLWLQYEYVLTYDILLESYEDKFGGVLSEKAMNEGVAKLQMGLIFSSIIGFIFQNLEIFFFSSFFHFLIKLDGLHLEKAAIMRITLISYFIVIIQYFIKIIILVFYLTYDFKFVENYYPLSLYSFMDYNSNFLAFLLQQINFFNIIFYISMGLGLYAITKEKESIRIGIKISFALSMVYTVFIILVKGQF